MPEWGLTEEQINTEPWGLTADLLRPDKKITDPIHGDIYLTALEIAVLDTAPMQRLRRVRQLGTTQLVYPGATHTRFSHALGTLRAAQNLMDQVLRQGSGRHAVNDLFSEWRSGEDAGNYERKVGEATVLARLGGLLHDLGHVPFGHTLEEDLGFLTSHDANEERYKTLWNALVTDLDVPSDLSPTGIQLPEALTEQLKALILSKSDQATSIPQTYPFISDLVGNTICADLIDYLQRDHLYAGLPAAFGSRFLDGFYVTRSDHPHQAQRMVIRISRGGRARADVVSELFKYLRYRYELSERSLVHHAKLAADVMVGKAMELWKAALAAEHGEEAAAKKAIEAQLLRRGDDGLLEHMLDEAKKHHDDARWQGIATIVSQLQSRKLFKPIGVYTRRAMADKLYVRYKSAEAREQVERAAANSAGADNGWMVALWVPNPEMRFKPAQVLVDDGSPNEIFALEAWDRENGRRGSEIIESHHGLWAMRAYVDQRLLDKREEILSNLQQLLGISEWDDQHRSSVQVTDERNSTGRVDSEAVPQADTRSRESSEQPPPPTVPSAALARLAEWRDTGRITIEHPDLEGAISGARDSVVRLGDEQFELDTVEAVIRLNLWLFLRELTDDAFGTPDGRDRVASFIRESPTDFEKRVIDRLGVGGSARRARESTGETNPATLAFEHAVQEFLDSAQGGRLLL